MATAGVPEKTRPRRAGIDNLERAGLSALEFDPAKLRAVRQTDSNVPRGNRQAIALDADDWINGIRLKNDVPQVGAIIV